MKKSILLLVLCAGCSAQALFRGMIGVAPGGGGGTPARLSKTGTNQSAYVASVTLDSSTGGPATLLVFPVVTYFGVDPSTACAISSSPSQTWSHTTASGGTSGVVAIFYAYNPTPSTTQSITLTCGGAYYPAGMGLSYTGTLTASSPLEAQNGASGGATTQQPGGVAPGTNNDLLVTVAAANSNSGWSIDSGFTVQGAFTNGFAVADYIQSTAGAVNPIWTATSGVSMSAGIAVFKHK